ncbi:hydroxyacid dehydrogenase [Streptomyces sp. NPDC058052]|uniref:hydroxyacid dehydrogenase n=1 Tax=Streptomyces sp. NPDC058052 TaxID=3346316 RepID=UPI0036E59E09
MPTPTPASAPPARPRALFAMARRHRDTLFPPAVTRRLATYVDIDPDRVVDDFTREPALGEVELLITSWGCPVLDRRALARMPALKAVVHAAGSVKHHITRECWDRGLRVSSAAAANAVPVAEYTVAAILFANKRVLDIGGLYREHRAPLDWAGLYPGFGNYRRTVGIVGASLVGRKVLELLRPHDLDLLLADPHADAERAAALGARHVELDELVRRSDVVSLHAPALPETRHLMDARRLALMRDGATLVNTARGSLVDTDALTAEAVTGRIHAVVDVTEPEVLPAASPLYTLPNVLLTPHIAGSLGGELLRISADVLDEVARYGSGAPFAHAVHEAALATSA